MTTNLYALNRDGADPGGHILPNLLRFAEVLRRLGLDAGPANVLDMVRATEYVHIGRRGEFYQAARSIFVHRKQDLPIFDEAFNVFWRKPNTARSGHGFALHGRAAPLPQAPGVSRNRRADGRRAGPGRRPGRRFGVAH